MRPPTRAEHDAIVAAHGRPYTQDPPRRTTRTDPDTEPLSLIDAYLGHFRRTAAD